MRYKIVFDGGPFNGKHQETERPGPVIHRMMAGEQGWVRHAYRLETEGEFGRSSIYSWDHCEVHGELTEEELASMMIGVARRGA